MALYPSGTNKAPSWNWLLGHGDGSEDGMATVALSTCRLILRMSALKCLAQHVQIVDV